MDLYNLLGVDREASADEIERAYRRLLRRYHPGVNPGDRVAADMCRQVQEAYSILADAERRHEYDRGISRPVVAEVEATVSFEGFDFSALAQGASAATFSELFADVFQDAAREATAPTRGGDVEATLSLSFEAAMRGGTVPLSVARMDRCPSCHGEGHVQRASVPCPVCAGEGTRRWARGYMVFTRACDACAGAGQVTVQPCRACRGVGVAARSEVVTLTLPPGIESGARAAVPGRGHAGARGGPAGDLYVTIEVAPHPFFRRSGRDLLLTLPVAVHEAALGARVNVPTLDGPVRLRIPAGTSSGQRIRMSGGGAPASSPSDPEPPGDLIVEIQVVLPASLDDRSRDLLREFGRLNDTDVRQQLFDA